MTTTKQTQHQVLDPSLLGRPVHLLHIFAAQLRDDLAQSMRLNMNRRYWGGFQVQDVAFSRLEGNEIRSRWLSFAAPAGHIAFSMERKVLLSVLNYRYGSGAKAEAKADAKTEAAPAVDESTVRVTATEERLAVVLGQQLCGTLAGRIELNLPVMDKPALAEGEAEEAAADAEFKPAPGSHPPKGTWVISVTVSEIAGGASGQFWFALDKQLMTSVLRGLLRDREAGKKPKAVAPLAQRLQVGLIGRLASKEVTLGSLYDLQVGDVIPISLARADVLLEDSRLFTAAVTEHKGKLCLTSFEDAE
ncbi:flagellar motor switch protein FliM [Duganella sp. CF402]|uniref:FliM/FliN family flagellar motor switch protein n=1 Tax=unclassified Duganella TaxID=2636909 RepID=UPI0008CA0E05|nr:MULTISPECIES: FliM/FliN family flagellar motor switch protein [unclassified Duganella]RZT10004.1 flagellar motor switch protein FliM [Duganella sp. BK701]SEL33148.1 flagellar motor switch protein FliM [Duganella sp. CF402]